MITTGDIADILFSKAKKLGIKVYHKDTCPNGEISSDRVIIIMPELEEGMWQKGFAHINIEVPDVNGKIDITKLSHYEELACQLFNDDNMRGGGYGCYKNTSYQYSVGGRSTESDTDLKCHYVSLRIKFEILNY